MNTPHSPLTLEQREQIVAARRAGSTLRAIRAAFGVSNATIIYWSKRAGYRSPLKGQAPRIPSDRQARVIAAYRAGYTQTEIANHLGCDRQCVRTVLKHHGIAGKPGRRPLSAIPTR